MPTIDLYTTSGAFFGGLMLLIWGLLRDKKFDWRYLPEYLAQAATGTFSSALWQAPDNVSPVVRIAAGFLCGLGAKGLVNWLRTAISNQPKV